MSFPTGCKDVVYQLRAQGFTLRAIEVEVAARFPTSKAPDHTTIREWLADPDAAALVQQETTRLRAKYVNAASDLVPALFSNISAAVDSGESGKVRDLAQALSAVTRGIVRDQLEITPGKVIDTPDELAAILARNGVLLSSEHKNALSDANAKTPDVSTPSAVDAPQHTPDNTR